MGKHHVDLKTLLWDITSKCNLRCIHCYNTVKYPRTGIKNELTTEEAKEAIEKISKFGFRHIHLLGGEPLVRHDLFELIEYARNYEMEVTINSNGILLNVDKIKRLIELGVSQFVFSLDGATEEVNDKIRGKGTFQRVIKNIKLFKEIKEEYQSPIKIGIAFTLTKYNLHQMDKLVGLAIQLGIDALGVMDLYISGDALTNRDNLYYSDEERIFAYEELAKSCWKNRDKLHDVTIQIDTLPSLGEYLNKKYDLDLAIHPRNVGCGAGTIHWLMEADGTLHPCGMADNPFYNTKPIQNGLLKLEDINIKNVTSVEEVLNSEYFLSFLEFKEKFGRANRSPCVLCSFRDTCIQCPFRYYNQINVRECQEVVKQKLRFIQSIKNRRFHINNDKILTKNGALYVYDPIFRKYKQVNHTGELVIKKIEEGMTPENIAEWLVAELESEGLDKRVVLEDICFFVNNLSLMGILQQKGGDAA